MADGKIEFDTKINTSGVEKGIKNVQGKLNTLKNTGMSAVIAAEVKALKDLTKVVKETSDVYNVQIKGETALKNAVKNNPYLDNSSVKKLKDFASQLQSISTMGDEEILPFMAQLASAGRTETEIQDILAAALDVSASGAMSFESAVKNLNKTYSGLAGELGESIPQLKTLTQEELKHGDAVKLVAEQYKGMAEATTKATGSFQQMKNAQGDYNEAIGRFTKPSADMWNNWWKSFYEQGTKNINKINAQLESSDLRKNLNGSYNKGSLASDVTYLTDEDLSLLQEYYSLLDKRNKKENAIYDAVVTEIDNRYLANRATEIHNQELEKQKKLEEDLNAPIKARDALRAQYDKTIDEAKKEIEIRKTLGEDITKEQEAQELLNVATNAYIAMMSDPAFNGNSGMYQHEVDARQQIAQWAEIANAVEDTEDAYAELKHALNAIKDDVNPVDALKNQLNTLDELAKGLDKNSELYKQYAEKRKQLDKQIEKAQKESVANQLANLNSYFSEFLDITTSIANLVRTQNEKNTEKVNGELAKQYNDGLLSYEEYNEKKAEASKKASKEEYKIKMWEWTASLLTATANVAEGVSKAIAQGGTLGLVTGALVAASGAIQIATISANKPVMPAYKNGGVIGGMNGASYGNDNTTIKARTGEMVLNAIQQKQLWKMANGGSAGGSNINMPITIENNNGSSIQTQFNKNGLRVVVDNMVNASMSQGRYTKSMNVAKSKANGGRIL